MAHGRKGNVWRFGMKARVGVDAGGGLVHMVTTTPASVADVDQAHPLLRPDDLFCHGTSGYTGVAGRPEVAGDPALAGVRWTVAARPTSPQASTAARPGPTGSASGERPPCAARVEHVFLVVERQFGYARCRYRGIAKNLERVTTPCALANLALVDRARRRLSHTPA